MKRIRLDQDFAAEAVTPCRKSNAQAKLFAIRQRRPTYRDIGLEARTTRWLINDDLIKRFKKTHCVTLNQGKREIGLCRKMIVDACLANTHNLSKISIAEPINPARIRIALAEKGVAHQVDFVAVDFMGGEHRTPAFKAKNPDATVPLLELDDGTYISHCNAITEYIDQHFDGPSLCGTIPAERAVIQMMNLRAQEGLLDALVAYFHHATPGLGPVLKTFQLLEWGLRQRERALATMHYLDGVLGECAYLAGDFFP